MLALVLADRDEIGMVEEDVGGLEDRIGIEADPDRPAFSDLDLNWVIRFIQPIGVTQLRIQASSACWRTWLCRKMIDLSGSIPQAT